MKATLRVSAKGKAVGHASKQACCDAPTSVIKAAPFSPDAGSVSSDRGPIDSLLTLRHDAGLGANTGDCPDFGQVVEVAFASPHPWGDVDCGGDVTPVDSLKLLRFDAGFSVTQEPGCPEIGSAVLITP